jgi:hypothetical protein
LTVPVLKALDEIVKASRQETHSITQKSLEYSSHIKSETQHLKERNQNLLSGSSALSSSISSGSCYRDTDISLSTDFNEDTKSGFIEGDIRISGFPKSQETLARISGYCEQNDTHSP